MNLRERVSRVLDRLRCYFADCPDRHPAATAREQVTCPRCRRALGLQPL